MLENPVTTPVNYGSGWNWIGYLPHVSISVNQALANITAPVSGYLIKNQTGYSQYIEGYGWYGSMLFMEAGKGYMLHASDSGSFTYPDYIFPRDDIPTLSGANIDKLRELTGWDLNPLDYEYSSNVTSVVQCNNVLLNEENIVLGAFYGSECRGIAVPVKVLDQWVFFLTQYSNVINQQLSYKVYLADNDEVLDAAETLPFVNNQILGNPLNPYTFHIAVESLQIPQNLSLTVEESALTLSWDAVAGAVSYKVFASNTPTGDFTEVTSLGSFIRAAESKTDTFSSSIHSFEKPGTAEERARQSWFCTIPDMQKMFYYITASTDSRRF